MAVQICYLGTVTKLLFIELFFTVTKSLFTLLNYYLLNH